MYQLKNSHKPSYKGKKILQKFQVIWGTRKKNIQQQIFAGGHFAIGGK